ncbi:hypothetical protein [Anaerosacchariphilus polymeriproducens]|uniref:Phage protein n=1 Tax=Anaerosacchariphilus polymeriproducens TaxID=1812858 RepID=A0A371ARL3_9FIRM|nr:hypothetical protein [Anaerosacchariphilus polymeriproducens]RDU22205.1 hypothetical protein DWV06_16910 [Anaerosacchariphilus polymeriproducens]
MDEVKMKQLVELVKAKLKITWNEDETNSRIRDIVEAAIPTLNHKLGVAAFDYTKCSQERNLFFNYCMYEWWDRIDEFDRNYSGEMMQIRIKNEVAQYAKPE